MARPNLRLVLALLAALAGSAQAPAPAKTSAALQARLRDARPGESHAVFVYFRDKTGAGAESVTTRALQRRERRGRTRGAASFEDQPLPEAYVRAVEARTLRLRQRLRWLNAVSALATRDQIAELQALPFVARLDVVRAFRRGPVEPSEDAAKVAGRRGADDTPHALDYGSSLGQLQQIGVPALHDRGLDGEGVMVAVFDTGFDNLAHEVFARTHILARHDFVNGDGDVGNGGDRGEGSHGTNTLSVLGGFREGQLIGPAYAATFLLAKTEDTQSETKVEEDNWAAAAEWAESLGADVISSSLGYLEFDRGQPSYSFADMDGRTAIVTRAAELAAERGVVVVNSAGNSGFHPSHNTLGAPSDGAHVLAVAAVTSNGARASFSSVGPSADGRVKPDVAAQGQDVKVAGSRPGEYRFANGTSFSCPLTAGAVALLLQARPELSADDVLAVVRGTAKRAATPDSLTGYGIVDAVAAVEARRP